MALAITPAEVAHPMSININADDKQRKNTIWKRQQNVQIKINKIDLPLYMFHVIYYHKINQ